MSSAAEVGLEGVISEAITYYTDSHNATGNFDYVVANPPFNVDNVKKDLLAGGVGKPGTRFPWGVPTTDNANYLWISLFASALKPGSRAGFVMANSASDARGSEQAIRQRMIQEGLIEAMVSVGNNMFYTVTLPVTLWFLGTCRISAELRSWDSVFRCRPSPSNAASPPSSPPTTT